MKPYRVSAISPSKGIVVLCGCWVPCKATWYSITCVHFTSDKDKLTTCDI